METFFRTEGLFYRVMMKVWQLLILNLLILITSIPIITIGAAQTAGFVVTKQMMAIDEGRIVSVYWQAFKKNIKISSILLILISVLFYFLWIDWQYLLKIDNNQTFMTVGVLIVTIIIVNFAQYAFFYQASFNDTVKNTFINTLKLLLKRPLMSLFLIIVLISPYLVLALSGYFMIFGIYLNLFLGFSLHLYLRTIFLSRLFKKIIQ